MAIVFKSGDKGPEIKKKLNELVGELEGGIADVEQAVIDAQQSASDAEQSKIDAEGFKNQAEAAATNAANDVRSELEDVRDETEGFRDETALIKADFETAFGGLSYLAPVEYGSGIEIDSAVKTVEFDGEVYAPLPSEVPFTTSGTFESDKFRLIQGVTTQQMASTAAGGFAANIGRNVVAVDSIADLLALPPGARRGDLRYLVASYEGGWAVEATYLGPRGGGEFYWDPDSTADEDFGTIFQVPGVTVGRFVRRYVGPVDVSMFNAKGDGTTDDSIAINLALAVGGEIRIPKPRGACYRIVSSLSPKSNSTIILDAGTLIKPVPGSSSLFRFFDIREQENVTIKGNGATLDAADSAYVGEYSHSISVSNSPNTRIYELNILNSKGDGIYIGGELGKPGCDGSKVVDCLVDTTRRQGIAIALGSHIIIDRCEISTGVSGSPRLGIDIEANPGGVVDNVLVSNCLLHHCSSTGVGVVLASNCTVSNSISHDNSASGFVARNALTHSVKFIGCSAYGNSGNGFYITNASDVSLLGCSSVGNGNFGIQGVDAPNLKISETIVRDNTNRGISAASPGLKQTVTGCEVENNGDYGIYIAGRDAIVSGNRAINNGTANIYIFGGPGAFVTRNMTRTGDRLPGDGILVRNAPLATLCLITENDCVDGGEDYGIRANPAQAIIGFNRNKDGSYSDTPN